MNIKFASALVVSLVLFLFIWITLTVVLPVEPQAIPTLDLVLMPGSITEPDCQEKYQPPSLLTCEIPNRLAYITYSIPLGRVIRVVYQPDAITIGKLVSVWGTPLFYKNYGGLSILVSWGLKSAFVYPDNFRPDSAVTYIQYDIENDPTVFTTWKGFSIR